MRAREIEWQFDTDDLERVSRWVREVQGSPWRARALPVHELSDQYFDTPDWRFFRAGFALRVRRRDGHCEAMLKSFGTTRNGRRERLEIAERLHLPTRAQVAPAVRRAPGEVGQRVRAVCGPARLRRLFEVRTQRQRLRLALPDGTAELALDVTRFRAGRRDSPPLAPRVEFEVPAALVARLSPWAARMRRECGLRAARSSKYEAGLRFAGYLPELAAVSQATVRSIDAAGSPATTTALRAQVARLRHCEPAVRLGEDSEAVHVMRVAIRRLRVALRLLAATLPGDGEVLRQELRWLGRRLGALRDLDVQIAQLDRWNAARGRHGGDHGSVVATLRRRRASRQRELLRALDSRRHAALDHRLVELLDRELRQPPTRLRRDIERAIDGKSRRVRKLARRVTADSTLADLHTLRIAARQLRYALEFATPLLRHPPHRPLALLARLQTTLGRHRDTQVALGSLRRLERSAASARQQRALRAVVRRYGHAADRARAQIAKQARPLSRRHWWPQGGDWRP